MIETLKAGYDGIKAALDIAQGISALKTETAVNQAVIEIQRHALDGLRALTTAEQVHAADLKRITELEQQIAGFENWETEKQRYELKAIDAGAFAYMLKPGMEKGEPVVWLCQTCFENRHKSPLQFRARMPDGTAIRGTYSKWGCNLCRAELTVYYARQPHIPWEPKAAG